LLRVVFRTVFLWVISLLVAGAGVEAAHRMVLAIDRGATAPAAPGETSTASVVAATAATARR
jgi:hypothetical protein